MLQVSETEGASRTFEMLLILKRGEIVRFPVYCNLRLRHHENRLSFDGGKHVVPSQ